MYFPLVPLLGKFIKLSLKSFLTRAWQRWIQNMLIFWVSYIRSNTAGGYAGDGDYYDDILEYDPEEDSIIPVGQMTQPRVYHAVSVVQAQDYAMWCQWGLQWPMSESRLILNFNWAPVKNGHQDKGLSLPSETWCAALYQATQIYFFHIFRTNNRCCFYIYLMNSWKGMKLRVELNKFLWRNLNLFYATFFSICCQAQVQSRSRARTRSRSGPSQVLSWSLVSCQFSPTTKLFLGSK